MLCKGTKKICGLQALGAKIVRFNTLNSLNLVIRQKVGVSHQEREGDGRVNEYPSRALTPLYIGL